MSAPEKLPGDVLGHRSGINAKGDPFVQLIRGTEVIAQMDVAQAREYGQAIIEAAEAAQTDAFVYQWLIQHVRAGPEQAAGLLADFRRYRERGRKSK